MFFFKLYIDFIFVILNRILFCYFTSYFIHNLFGYFVTFFLFCRYFLRFFYIKFIFAILHQMFVVIHI